MNPHLPQWSHPTALWFFATALLQTMQGYFTVIVLRVYVYDPSLLKKCSHKDKPIVELRICKKIHIKKQQHKHSER